MKRCESVEEFLARGGQVTSVDTGKSSKVEFSNSQWNRQ